MDKKIRFSAEENVSPVISKLKRDSEELGRSLIRDARAYTTSGKETLSYIEEQIKAIEKRSRAERHSQMIALESEKQRGKITPEQFKQQAAKIGLESKVEEQQVSLLRELIDTVKQSSKREIIEDRKGVEKQLKESKTLEKLSPKGDELKLLKETLQRQELGNIKQEERDERDKLAGVKRIGERVNQVGGMAAGSQNEFFMAAATMSFIPIIGGAISSLVNRALSQAQAYQSAAGGMSQVGGGGYGRYLGRGSGLSSIGLTRAEFLATNKEVAITRGMEAGSYQPAIDISYLERGTTASRGNLLELSRLTRAGGQGEVESVQNLVKAMQSVGGIKGQDLATMDEHLSMLVNLQREQLEVTGETNTVLSTKMMAGIASLDESFKNQDVLRGVMTSITSGLRRPSTPQVEALQFGILSAMKPGATLSELQESRETPTLEYFKSTLENLRQISPNEEMLIQNIKGVFGLEGKTAIARKIARGEVNIGDYSNEAGIIDFKGRAVGATGALDRSSAEWNQKFEDYGNRAVNFLDELINDMLPEGFKSFMEFGSKINSALEKIIKSLDFLGLVKEDVPEKKGKAIRKLPETKTRNYK